MRRDRLSTTSLWLLGIAAAALVIILPALGTLLQSPPVANVYFSLEKLQLGRAFSRESVLLSTLLQLLDLAMITALALSPWGAGWVARVEKRFRRPAAAVSVMTGVVTLAEGVLTLPFSYYLGFVREHRWGLSVQHLGSWLRDYTVSFTIGWVINLVVVLMVYALIRRSPQRWWVPTGTLMAAFAALMVLIYPIVIDPLFVEREPMKNPQVMAMAQRLADRAGVKLDGVWEEKASLKTNRANAMVTGLGPTKRIVIWDTLLRDYPPDEVESVVAHELGHAVYRDILWSWLITSAVSFLGCWLFALILNRPQRVGSLSWNAARQPRVVVVAMLLLMIMGTLSSPLANTLSRLFEARADHFSLEVAGKPEAFIASEVRLALNNPGNYDPPRLIEWLRYDHPSTMSRIRAAEKFSSEQRMVRSSK